MENIFRAVNIAMVNELKLVLDRMDVNIWEVIDAAKTKPLAPCFNVETIYLRNSKFKNDDSPIDNGINIRNLNAYSKSYINHLINTNEILASMILTLNNIIFFQQLMKKIREAIKTNSFDKFHDKYINLI